MDRLGDLSQFDGHTPGPWDVKSIAVGFPGKEDEDIVPEMFGPNCSLATAAPELLAALKESRKEVEELRESNKVLSDWNDDLQRMLNDVVDGQKEAAELRENAQRAKTILQEEIESIEQEDGGRGCVTAMIDAIVELEGKQ